MIARLAKVARPDLAYTSTFWVDYYATRRDLFVKLLLAPRGAL